jgi:hypothetical protein
MACKDGWLRLIKEGQLLIQCQVVRAEDVDVVEICQDESIWAEGGSEVSEQ